MRSRYDEAGGLFHGGLCLDGERGRLGRPKVGSDEGNR